MDTTKERVLYLRLSRSILCEKIRVFIIQDFQAANHRHASLFSYSTIVVFRILN